MEVKDIELIRDTYNKAYEKGKKAGEKKVVEAVEKLHLVRPEREDKWQEFLKEL